MSKEVFTETPLKIPPIDAQLLAALKQVFPDRLPINLVDVQEKTVAFLVGQQSIIKWLQNVKEEQDSSTW